MNKTLRNIIIIIASIIVLAVVALGIMFFYDAPLPDDSAYKTTCNPAPPETNAIVTLEKLAGKVKASLNDYPEFNGYVSIYDWEDLLSGNRIDFELQVPVVVRNQEALSLLLEAMKKPNAQFAPPFPKDGTLQDYGPSATAFMDVNKIARMTWQNIKDGKVVFSWGDALDNILLVKKYGTAENTSLINFLVALACVRADFDLLIKNIASLEDREVAIKAASLLNDGALKPADFNIPMKTEYGVIDEQTRRIGNISRNWYLFKPNDTRQRALDIFEKIKKAISRGDQDANIPPAPRLFDASLVEKSKYMLRPNATGRALVDLVCSNYGAIYKSMMESFAPFRVSACAFALRAYWLDHGRLPDSLDELAPEYIKTVPLDIYGGKPVQYDRDRAVVYSAGPKLVYSTGEFAREPHPSGERPFVLLDWAAPATAPRD